MLKHTFLPPVKSFWVGSVEPILRDVTKTVTGYDKRDAIRIFHNAHLSDEDVTHFYLHRLLLTPHAKIYPHFITEDDLSKDDIYQAEHDAYLVRHNGHHIINDHSISLHARIDKVDVSHHLMATTWDMHDALDTHYYSPSKTKEKL